MEENASIHNIENYHHGSEREMPNYWTIPISNQLFESAQLQLLINISLVSDTK